MDLTPLLNTIPPPWNMLAIFGAGILAKILHSRLTQPSPAPSPAPAPGPSPAPVPAPAPSPSTTPILDAIRLWLSNILAQPVSKDIEPAHAMEIVQSIQKIGK